MARGFRLYLVAAKWQSARTSGLPGHESLESPISLNVVNPTEIYPRLLRDRFSTQE